MYSKDYQDNGNPRRQSLTHGMFKYWLNQLMRIDGPLAIKRVLYSRKGEPYSIAGYTLRFVPGTRPFHLKCANLPPERDDVARYDSLQQLFLIEHLKSGAHAVDVGANAGQDSLIMAALCGPKGRVTAFEPNAEAREVFMRNVALNPHIKPPELLDAAISDTDGSATLFNEPGRSANSSLTASANGAAAGYNVQTLRLDTWMRSPPQLMKIDIEGFEIRALEGARRLLKSPAIILCELHPYAWPAMGDSYEGLRVLLAQHGRRARYLDETGEPTRIRYGIVELERI
jgi:FkbM family methyltransferase